MIDEWTDTDYAVCPTCGELVRREELANSSHTCRVFSQSRPWG